MTREEFLSLYEKCLSEECTAEEKRLLDSYHDEMVLPDNKWAEGLGDEKEIYNDIRRQLNQSLHSKTRSGTSRRLWIKVAAAILVVLSSAALLSKIEKSNTIPGSIVAIKTRSAIPPGGNKAYLTMAGGAVIILNNAQNGKVGTQSGVQISKTKDGLLVYRPDVKDAGKLTASETQMNTFSTPRGGQYQIVLSDGTKVWLNSASSLKYPVVFNGKERRVELTGEAYFEVAKNKERPFKVVANKQTVEVLGTHFNISAYSDENIIKTTLLEGSVKVSGGGKKKLIAPGEQAQFKDGDIQISEVNVNEVTAWKRGVFQFRDDDIKDVMKQVSRWYDVDIKYEGNLPDRKFSGGISRNASLSQILDVLNFENIHFRVDGKTIIVTQ